MSATPFAGDLFLDPAVADPAGLAQTRHRLVRGLRWASLLIATTVVLIPGGMVRHWSDYQGRVGSWVQVACWSAISTVIYREWWLILRHRSWGRLSGSAGAMALVASCVAQAAMPPGMVATAGDWTFGTLGWVFVILCLKRPRSLLLLLGAHEVFSIMIVATRSPAPRDSLLDLLCGSMGALGYPLAMAIAGSLMRSVGQRAHAAAWQAEQIRTAEAASEELHAQRQCRFAGLYESAAPLLRGLANGTLDPFDERPQRACRIEAARMRRLFAETDVSADPLMHELRQGADVAERHGVEVTVQTLGTWSQPPVEVRRALLDAPLAALTAAHTRARVTVLGTHAELAVGVVADATELDLRAARFARHDRVQLFVVDGDNDEGDDEGGETWVEARWTIA
ncbi:MAG: hypothetical protein IPJ14_17705 [Kineosporiaceae bacterium]|nr:hypothetical protein [Kineosporiaceae bacterium]MBK7624438.1 hypothetical protein [Kineosporiaceae bacterium]MBK8077802.1 hypothetical protein [Kineosporiaceae bacterium]